MPIGMARGGPLPRGCCQTRAGVAVRFLTRRQASSRKQGGARRAGRRALAAGPGSALIGMLGQSDAFGYVFDRQGQKADQIGAFFVVRGDQV